MRSLEDAETAENKADNTNAQNVGLQDHRGKTYGRGSSIDSSDARWRLN